MLNSEQEVYIDNLRTNYPGLSDSQLAQTLADAQWPSGDITEALQRYNQSVLNIETTSSSSISTQGATTSLVATSAPLWMIVGLPALLALLVGAGAFYFLFGDESGLESGADTAVVNKTENVTLTQEEADKIFVEHYERLYAILGSPTESIADTVNPDPLGDATSLIAKESWKLLVYSDIFQDTFFFYFLNPDIRSSIMSHMERIRTYSPPSEEERQKFEAENGITIGDGMVTFPSSTKSDPNVTYPRSFSIDESGRVEFLPPRPVTTILNNDVILFKVEGFYIALARQDDATWKFDLHIPYKEGIMEGGEMDELYKTAITQMSTPAMMAFLEWFYIASNSERYEFLDESLRQPGEGRTQVFFPTNLIGMLTNEEYFKRVDVSDSEMRFESSTSGEKSIFLIKKVGGKWTLTKG